MVIADPLERKKWAAIGVRRLIRESRLNQALVSNALKSKPLRPGAVATIRRTAARILGSKAEIPPKPLDPITTR
jgi:hypothetical protein